MCLRSRTLALDGERESQISNLHLWVFISTEYVVWLFWNDFRNVFLLLHFLICDMLLLKRKSGLDKRYWCWLKNVVNKAASIFLSWVVCEQCIRSSIYSLGLFPLGHWQHFAGPLQYLLNLIVHIRTVCSKKGQIHLPLTDLDLQLDRPMGIDIKKKTAQPVVIQMESAKNWA